MRAFVYFVFDSGSPNIERVIDAAKAVRCSCERGEGVDIETLHVEGDTVDISLICLMAEYAAQGKL